MSPSSGHAAYDERKGKPLEAARRRCLEEGYDWEEPVTVEESWHHYAFRTGADHRGGNAWIRVDKRSGEVTYFAFAAR